MTDFLDQRDLSALLTEEVADRAARAMIREMRERDIWLNVVSMVDSKDVLYTAPEFR